MYEQFVNLLVDELQIEESDITLDAELSNDLGINSIGLYDLITICEENFGLQIDEDNVRQFTTVGDIVNYLESLN